MSQEELRIDVGPVFGMAWVSDNQLVMSRTIGDATGPSKADAWTFDVAAERMQRIDLPGPQKGCRGRDYMRPARVSGRSVLLFSLCYSETFDGRLDEGSVVVVDLDTGQLQELVPSNVAFNPQTIAWHRGEGLISKSSGLCAGIARLTPDGVERWDVMVADRRVDEPVFSEAQDCSQEIRADLPAISQSGRIAFMASPDSVGIDGFARGSVPWFIYVMDENGAPEQLPVEIEHPSDLRWSPSGTALAFSGTVAGKGDGLWVMSLPQGELKKISGERVSSLDWAPEGERIAAVLESGEDAEWPRNVRLVIYRVTESTRVS
ncbi:MAG: hypothetical protein WD770_04555 [Actinomycetota bacterium]